MTIPAKFEFVGTKMFHTYLFSKEFFCKKTEKSGSVEYIPESPCRFLKLMRTVSNPVMCTKLFFSLGKVKKNY